MTISSIHQSHPAAPPGPNVASNCRGAAKPLPAANAQKPRLYQVATGRHGAGDGAGDGGF